MTFREMSVGEVPALSPTFAVLTILKGMIGSGILTLPAVFGRVHLAVAVPGYLLVTCICCFSVWRILECHNLLMRSSIGETGVQDYGMIVQSLEANEASDDSGTENDESGTEISELMDGRRSDHGLGPLGFVGSQILGSFGCFIAGAGIVLSQFGFVMAYFKIIFETLERPSLLGTFFSPNVLRSGVICSASGLMLLRDLSSIAKVAAFALAIYGYLLFALFRWGSAELAANGGPLGHWLPIKWDGLGVWLGTAIFAQEAMVVCQFVYDDMHVDNINKFRPVLLTSFAVCGILCAVVGGFGYWCYGDNINDVFYMNFPGESVDVRVSEALLSAVLLLSIPVQAYPIVVFLDYMCGISNRTCSLRSSLIRWFIVGVSAGVGLSIRNLSCLTGYSGSFAMSLIGFFLPPMCHMKLCKFQLSVVDWCLDIMLFLVGMVAIYEGIVTTAC